MVRLGISTQPYFFGKKRLVPIISCKMTDRSRCLSIILQGTISHPSYILCSTWRNQISYKVKKAYRQIDSHHQKTSRTSRIDNDGAGSDIVYLWLDNHHMYITFAHWGVSNSRCSTCVKGQSRTQAPLKRGSDAWT